METTANIINNIREFIRVTLIDNASYYYQAAGRYIMEDLINDASHYFHQATMSSDQVLRFITLISQVSEIL